MYTDDVSKHPGSGDTQIEHYEPFLGHPGFLSYVWLLIKAAEFVLVKGSIVPGSRLDNIF